MTTFTREQLIEKLRHRLAVTSNYPDVEEAQFDAVIFKIALAAMLQAGNSPVVPDGWISCSERMPEECQEVIVMDTEGVKVQSGMIYKDGCFVDFNEEYYEVKNPSHWMPLPLPPSK